MMAALAHGWKPTKARKKLPQKKVAVKFHTEDYPSHSDTKKAFDVAWEHIKS
jgi:hypothetical protein